jgi:hypothetical protein
MNEYANGHFDLIFARIHRMCKVIAPKRTKDSCYVDIDELLVEAIGINYDLLEALTTGVTLKYKLKERMPILDLPIFSIFFLTNTLQVASFQLNRSGALWGKSPRGLITLPQRLRRLQAGTMTSR